MLTTGQQSTETTAAIQFLSVEKLAQIPAPFLRVTTCGLLSLEVIEEVVNSDPPLARYRVLSPEHLHGRGPVPALMLLKLLVSRPQRFALRDWLMQQFCHEREVFSNVRLDNIASQLRSLLCPEAYEGLRTHLVAHARSRSESGDGFQLASYPLIWIDHEALAWNVEQAARMERFGDDALPFWERAYALARGGEYLPDERYSDWATQRREEVAGMRKQCVRALARLYQERQGKAGEEEALLLLRSYWHEHPQEEDVLRPLMKLLGQQECYQEALEAYERLCTQLKEEKRQPAKQTQDVAAYLRTKLIRRGNRERMPLLPSSSWLGQGPTPPLLLPIHEHEHSRPKESAAEALWNQQMSAQRFLSPRARVPNEGFSKLTEMDEQTLLHFGILTETCLRLSEGSQLGVAEQILWSYLPTVEAATRHASRQQQLAASITAQGYLIAASLVGHRNDLRARQFFSEQALVYGKMAQDTHLQVAALRQLAVTFDYGKRPQDVLRTYQQTFPALQGVAPRLRACVYAAISGVHAQLQNKHESDHFIGLAYDHFAEQESNEPPFLRLVNAHYHTLVLWDGLNHLELGQPYQAERILTQLNALDARQGIPERIRIELLNYQAETFVAVNDLERACAYLETALEASVALQSARRLQEAFAVFQKAREAWPHEVQVQRLGDLFLQKSINQMQ